MSAFPEHVTAVSPLNKPALDGTAKTKGGTVRSNSQQPRLTPRLTPAEESRGASMFRNGASERTVANSLGCSASTAHRLKERIDREARAVRPERQREPEHRSPVSAVPAVASAPSAADLRRRREELAEELARVDERLMVLEEAAEITEVLEALRLVSPATDRVNAIWSQCITDLEGLRND